MTHARSAPPDDRVAAGFPLSDGPLSDIAEQMKNGQLDAVPAPVFSFNDIREAASWKPVKLAGRVVLD